MSKTVWVKKSKGLKNKYSLKKLKITMPFTSVEARVMAMVCWDGKDIKDIVVCESAEMAKDTGWVKEEA